MQEITFNLGVSAISGKGGILDASALSPNKEGIPLMLDHALSALDPFTFTPREPINENHHFAHLQKLHYSIIKNVVAQYIQHNWDDIINDWKPIHSFFYRLYKNSPIYRPYCGHMDQSRYYDTNEIGNNLIHEELSLPDRTSFGERDGVQSIRHICRNPDYPEEGDKEAICNWATCFIHFSTFVHSYLHRSQYKRDGPHVTIMNNPISLSNYGNAPYGRIDVNDAITQETVKRTFERFSEENYSIMYDSFVYDEIKKEIEKHRDEYIMHGMDPDDIMYATVI